MAPAKAGGLKKKNGVRPTIPNRIRMDDYTCECPLGTAGANCEREVDFEHIVPSFGGDSFMLFNSKEVARE